MQEDVQMIQRFMISNFKALQDFSIDLPKFTCLTGLNDSGKSTLLQAFDFVRHLAAGDIEDWLDVREWKAKDIRTQPLKKKDISFRVEFPYENGHTLGWRGKFNPYLLICTEEEVYSKDESGQASLLMSSDSNGVLLSPASNATEMKKNLLRHEGSVISILSDEMPYIRDVRKHVCGINAFDMLSPHALRKRARKAEDSIGYGGELLSAFIHNMTPAQRERLMEKLFSFYPQVETLDSGAIRSGWKTLSVAENFDRLHTKVDARHLSDGVLRILAILAQIYANEDDSKTLLFDEIENGINPSVMEKLMDCLVEAPQQIIVSTHNPMILNYLEDSVARESVALMYRGEDGYVRSKRLFDIPSAAEKLEYMGPGEAYLDGDLAAFIEEAKSMDRADCMAAKNNA